MTNEIIKALDEYFSRDKKFIDTSRIPLICQDIHNIHEKVDAIDQKLDKNFVTKEAFLPVKNIVYGATAIILSGVLITLLYLINIRSQ